MSTVGAWGALFLATACIAAEGYVRFTHPALTETQLFLEYLPLHAAVGVTMLLALVVYRATDR